MKKLKMAMIGGGVGAFIGKIHREAVRMDGGVEVVAGMFNRDPSQNAEIAERIGVTPDRTYPTWQALVAGEAARADRIVVLEDGKVAIDGTPEEVFEREERLRETGLGVPQCTELVHRLRSAGMALDGKCTDIEECAELIAKGRAKNSK